MSAQTDTLRGKAVLITGAASGLGKMTATALARRGVKLFLIDIDDSVAEVAYICGKIQEVNGYDSCVGYEACSVTDYGLVQEAVDRAAELMGGIDIVFANAGIGKVVSLYGDMDIADATIDINFKGVRYTVAAASRYIEASQGYVLVNASMGGVVILPLMGMAYSPSKAAAATFGQAMNLHFTGSGACCGVLYLSEHNTPMENEFSNPLAKQLFRDNKLLRYGHKKRNPLNAVNAIIRAMEKRSLSVHEPGYTRLARYFPALVNWIVRRYMVRDMRGTLDLARQLSAK